ncbi:MAG: hypothetical protein QXT20_00570 [Candidatus Woesearchaeota archaeon]
MKGAILMVDDEADILEDFLYNSIRNHFPYFECIACKTSEEAVEISDYLDREGINIPIFIIDEVLKGSTENGNQLLSRFDQTHPRARKILLSGQATPEEIITALNEAGADVYIPKKQVIENKEGLIGKIEELLREYDSEEGIKFSVKDKDGSEIIIRPAETAYDIHAAAGLVYMVYAELEKRFRDGVITEEQARRKEKWDEADFTPDGRINNLSKHYVAMKGGKCVGTVRLWMDKGPLDGFDFGTGDRMTLRVGKWMVHPDYRSAILSTFLNAENGIEFKSPIAIPLLIEAFISAKYEFKQNELYLTCLPKLIRTYAKLGFKQVGEPFEHATLKGDESGDFPGKYVGMKLNIDEVMSEYFDIKEGKKSASDSQLSIPILDVLLKPLNSSEISKYITVYKTPWDRYY